MGWVPVGAHQGKYIPAIYKGGRIISRKQAPPSVPNMKQSTGDKENFEPLVYRQRSLAITSRQMTRADRSASVRGWEKRKYTESRISQINFSSER